jgi:hypothetical protein
LDRYLDFVAGGCRPNTVLATAYDLKVFFTVVDKPPAEVMTSDVATTRAWTEASCCRSPVPPTTPPATGSLRAAARRISS